MQKNDTILVVGATSSMAQAICRELAAREYQLRAGNSLLILVIRIFLPSA